MYRTHAVFTIIVLLFLSYTPLSLIAASNIIVDDESTAPYVHQYDIDSASIAKSSLTITQPPELAGVLMWSQSPLGGPMVKVSDADAAAGRYDVNMEIVLPHSLDDRYGCSPLQYRINDEGSFMNQSIVMIERGGVSCFFLNKLVNAMNVNPGMTVIYNNPANNGILRLGASDKGLLSPIMFWRKEDATLIRNYLEGRRAWLNALKLDPNATMPVGKNYTLPVRGTVIGTGRMDPTELTAFRQVAASFRLYDTSTSTLRDWKDIVDNPSLDPCLDRVIGLWCERGHVQSVYLKSMKQIGTFDKAWGEFRKLQYLTMDENSGTTNDKQPVTGLVGPVPPEICNWSEILSIQIETNSLTSLPACVGTSFTKLRVLLIDRNQITSLPTDLSGLRNTLVWFTASANLLTTLPPSMLTWTRLAFLDLNSNPKLDYDVSSLMFTGWSQVYLMSFAGCAFKGQWNPAAFDNLANLESVDFNRNRMAGSLPLFRNCSILSTIDASYNQFSSLPDWRYAQITSLDLGYNSFAGSLPPLLGMTGITVIKVRNNSFTGGIPIQWVNLTQIQSIDADNNLLSGPLEPLKGMLGLKTASFIRNRIATPTSANGDVARAITDWSGPGLIELHLDYNLLVGGWGPGLVRYNPQKLYMSHNGLTQLPGDLWASNLVWLDVSYNNLTGDVPTDVNSNPGRGPVTGIQLDGNPVLTPAGWPNTWLVFATPATFYTSTDGLYECPTLEASSSPNTKLSFEPSFTDYAGCRCARGRFGVPPFCDIVPVTATISPYGTLASSNETALQASNPNLFATILAKFDNLPSATIGGSKFFETPGPAVTLPPSFTDDWYGQDRLTVGLSTYWSIDLTRVRFDLATQREIGNFTSQSAFSLPLTAALQPVRAITVRLHISTKYFVGIQNSLVVSEGTRDKQGQVVQSLLGADWLARSVANSSFTRQPEYQQRYAAALSALVEPRVVEVTVLSNAASVYFSSRDSANTHFVATYSYSFTCPSNTVLRVNPNIPGRYECLHPIPPLEEYDLPVRYAVYIMVAISIAFILANGIVLGLNWNAPIYRAASRLFVSMILFFLTCLGAGAILYALEPKLDSSSDVCVGRAWLSALPMAGILAVLLVKTWRLYKIFCSTKIMKVTNASDADLMRTIVIICLLECVLLVVFSGLELSKPELRILGTVESGGFVFDRYRVPQCSQENGFLEWMAVQLVVVFIGMATATYLSIKTRHIPTAFNESSHIMACCAILLFFFAMIVPLDIWLQDRPEVGVMLQGFGQAFLTFAITAMLMGPKMFIALTYSEADQSLMTKEVTSGPNQSSVRGSVTSSSGNFSRASMTTPKPASTTVTPLTSVGSSSAINLKERPSITTNVPKFGTKAAPVSSDRPKAAPFRPSFVKPPMSRVPSAPATLSANNATSASTTTPVAASPTNAPSTVDNEKSAPIELHAIKPIMENESAEGRPSAASTTAAPTTTTATAPASTSVVSSPSHVPGSSPSSALPSNATASPTVAIHFRVQPTSPSRDGLSASPSSPPSVSPLMVSSSPGSMSPPLSPVMVGDSAIDFVRRLRMRLPQAQSPATSPAPTPTGTNFQLQPITLSSPSASPLASPSASASQTTTASSP